MQTVAVIITMNISVANELFQVFFLLLRRVDNITIYNTVNTPMVNIVLIRFISIYIKWFPLMPCLACLAYPVVSVDRWGTTDDLATSSLHSSRLSAFLMAAPSVKPVHSGMLSSHLFLCLPRLLPPWTVPCMTVLASPVDLVMWPYHLSFRCLTVVRRSSCGPMA